MRAKLLFTFSLSLLMQSCTFIEENIGVDLRIGKDQFAPIDATENKRSPDTNPDLTDIALETQKRTTETGDPYDGYEVNAASNGNSIRQIDASMNKAADDILLSDSQVSIKPTTTMVKTAENTSIKPKKNKSKKQNAKPKTQTQPTACVPVQDSPVVQAPSAKPVILTPVPVVKTEAKSKELKPVAPKPPVLPAPEIAVPASPAVSAAPKVEVPAAPASPAMPDAPKVETAVPAAPKVETPVPAAPKVEVPQAAPASAEEVLINPFPPFTPEPLVDDKATLEEQVLSMPPVPNLKMDEQDANLDEFKKSLKEKYKDEKKGNLDGVQEANLLPLDLNQ